ncbi:hypothetical protein PCANB_002850 [Pneumocystis canis]|nr:hypothetical protein PCK1_002881 [Pneumocystis canis]KAG5438362.1 hypothetical protein PCANB_002850 [Pneumocystis canis]
MVLSSNEALKVYSNFLLEKNVLNDEISALLQVSNSPKKDQLIESIGRRIQDLNNSTIKVVPLLSSYDNRLLKEHLDSLYTSYLFLKKNARPKLNFGFKVNTEMDFNDNQLEVQNNLDSVLDKMTLSLSETSFLHIKEKIHLYKTSQNNEVNLSDASFCIYLIHESEWYNLNVHHFKDSLVLANGICGPVRISNCYNCTFIVSCYQFRMCDCENVDVLIACKSKPTIENCRGIRFGPNPYIDVSFKHKPDFHIKLRKDFFEAWNKVQDFGWLKQNKSPNWDIIPEKNRWEAGKWEEIIHDTKEISDTINLIQRR